MVQSAINPKHDSVRDRDRDREDSVRTLRGLEPTRIARIPLPTRSAADRRCPVEPIEASCTLRDLLSLETVGCHAWLFLELDEFQKKKKKEKNI